MSQSQENSDDETNILIDENNNDYQNSQSVSSSKNNIYNNWTESNVQTLRDWKTSTYKASFIFETILEKYRVKINKFLLWSLICSTISTILSAISSTVLAVNNTLVWVSLGFNIGIFILNGIVTILNGGLEIYKWNEKVEHISKHIEKLDNFYSEISSELVLPDNLRLDAINFIKKYDTMYVNIMRQRPDISTSEYIDSNKKYSEFIKGNTINYNHAQKFNEIDSRIDMV